MNRNLRVRELPCIACTIAGVLQPLPSECHHLNLGGRAGQKRRGNEFSIPLCAWHHRGEPIDHVDAKAMAALYGPSLARESRRFRELFGTDDSLLARTNKMLERVAA